MTTELNIPDELDEAFCYLSEATKFLKEKDWGKQKAALALIFLVREKMLSVLNDEANHECTKKLHEECLGDIEDLTYMVYDAVEDGDFSAAEKMITYYHIVITALVAYFESGPEAFQEIEDSIEYEDDTDEDDTDEQEDFPISYPTLLINSANLIESELLLDLISLKNKLKGKIIRDDISKRSRAIDIIALREALWKVIADVYRCSGGDEEHEDSLMSIFCWEMWEDQTHIGGIIADFENYGKSEMGVLLLEKMIDMAKRFLNFCKNDDLEQLKGPFPSIDGEGGEKPE